MSVFLGPATTYNMVTDIHGAVRLNLCAAPLVLPRLISRSSLKLILSYLLEMEPSTALLRLKQISLALVIGGITALAVALPLMATDYPVRQGAFEAHILSSAAGMGSAAKPILRARVEDGTGRVFWLQLPSTHVSAAGTPLIVDVWCETDKFESCSARYLHSVSDRE